MEIRSQLSLNFVAFYILHTNISKLLLFFYTIEALFSVRFGIQNCVAIVELLISSESLLLLLLSDEPVDELELPIGRFELPIVCKDRIIPGFDSKVEH